MYDEEFLKQMFLCTAYHAPCKITVRGCIARYKLAKREVCDSMHPLYPCTICKIGAILADDEKNIRAEKDPNSTKIRIKTKKLDDAAKELGYSDTRSCIRSLYKEHRSRSIVADILGIPRGSIHHYFRKYNIQTRQHWG